MKVDVIIIGAGVAGLSIAAALGAQDLKTLIIEPRMGKSHFDFEFVFENATFIDLPNIKTYTSIASGPGKPPLAHSLVQVDSNALYQSLLKKCSEKGVAIMQGRAEKMVSYRKLSRVDWRPNQIGEQQAPIEEVFAPLVIDASGAQSIFSPRAEYQLSYFPAQKNEQEQASDDFPYYDFSNSSANEATFIRGPQRLAFGFSPSEDPFECAYFSIPLLGKHDSTTPEKLLPYGDSRAMAHPFTGEATSRILKGSPKCAKAIRDSFSAPPAEILAAANASLGGPEEDAFRDAVAFIFDDILRSRRQQKNFFEALLSPSFSHLLTEDRLTKTSFQSLRDLLEIAGSNTSFKPFSESFGNRWT